MQELGYDVMATARPEASYLSRRVVPVPIRVDPGLVDRGFGKTTLKPKFTLQPPSDLHRAAAGAVNPALSRAEALRDVLAAMARGEAAASTATTPRKQGAEGEGEEAEAEAEAEAEVPETPAADAASASGLATPHSPSSPEPRVDAAEDERLNAAVLAMDLSAIDLEVPSQPDACTPLMEAARFGTSSDLQLLLDAGASVRARDRHGNTPLHKACVCGSVPKVQALISAGADLEAYNRYGRTALHVAAEVGWEAVAALLVRMGAKHDAKDGPLRDGDTPFQVRLEQTPSALMDSADAIDECFNSVLHHALLRIPTLYSSDTCYM